MRRLPHRPFRGARRRRAPGAAPGTLSFEADAPPPVLRVFGISADGVEERELTDVDDLDAWLGRWSVVWVDVLGMGQGSELRALAARLGLHPLAMEDVVNLGQRAKLEAYEDHMFLVARMAHAGDAATEQLSLFFGEGWVLTVQERAGDCFDGVRGRLNDPSRQIRGRGADYLAYALLDSVIDSYFPALDAIGDVMEDLEEAVLKRPSPEVAQAIHHARRTTIALRRAIVPHRDAVHSLTRDPHPLIAEETRVFLRDVYDHVLRVTDLVETYRELAGDAISTYMTIVSNRMNEVMKVLTIIATIFIPLSFIAGLYGMNFDPGASPWNMPELGWRLGYPFALGLMLAVGLGMLTYMWRKGWLR